MYLFAIMKQFNVGTSLGNKLLSLQSSFKIFSKCNDSPVNYIPYHRVSTGIGAQRLTSINTKCSPLLNMKRLHQKISIRWFRKTLDLEVNTNVKNDVLLYKHESKMMYILSVSMNVFIAFYAVMVSYIVFLNSKNWKNMTFQEILRDFRNPTGYDLLLYISSPVIYIFFWIFISHTLKYVILRKGGKDITMVNYHPVKIEVLTTRPASEFRCKRAPATQKPVGLKVTGYKGFYMFDNRGEFFNNQLFTNTISPHI